MVFVLNSINCFTSEQQHTRILLNKITNNKSFVLEKQKYCYTGMTHKYVALMLRVYLRKLQNKEKTNKLKLLSKIQNSTDIALVQTLSLFKQQSLSWGVFFLYSLFFWNTGFNDLNSIYFKKKKSISNHFNSVAATTKQNQPSINRYFIERYDRFKFNKSFRFSQPLLAFLIKKQTKYNTALQSNYANETAIRSIMHFVFSDYLFFLSTFQKAKSWKGKPNLLFYPNKTSKIIYALNQYTLNVLNFQ